MTKSIRLFAARGLLALVVFAAPFMMMWGQEKNRKFSLTTQIFLEEAQQQKLQQASGKRRAPAKAQDESERLVASPDTIGGVAYISCFVHLDDPNNLSEVLSLGVRVQETFGNLDFVTANVPIDKLEALAGVDNVTKIEAAQLMHISSDVARQKTNVDDLLQQTSDATNRGILSKYDGTGVVLGIVDTGIDFQHIAFKDKNGVSRIKRAYIYNGSGDGIIYTDMSHPEVTTDDNTEDHGTHTASTAGGSSVIVNKIADDDFTITVTDDHANATYGGMAPGVDLYLAGVKGLKETELINATKKIVEYADSVGKPVVVSNSWGGEVGARDGTGTLHSFVHEYFGDSHPNRIILFASANNAGKASEAEGGGYFVVKKNATQADPLYTILRTSNSGGDQYQGYLSNAYSDVPMRCVFYVLNTTTNEIVAGAEVTENTSFTDISVHGTPLYAGTLRFYFETFGGGTNITIYSNGFTSEETGTYSLAFAFEPIDAEATANIYSFACKNHYYTDFSPIEGITWTNGTDDVSVSDETTIPDAISIGAYMSKKSWLNYIGGEPVRYIKANDEDDIADFSSYATAEQSPTGLAYPWITAPGAMVAAGVNHFHTGDGSYYAKEKMLLVNNPDNPYGVMQGTSMATPVAAGIVALWLQAANEHSKTLTVNQVKDIMARTAINDSFTTTGSNASHFGQGKIDALAGIHYIIDGTIDLIDNAYNNTMISRNAGSNANVMLYGRTLWKDGAWNTLCLPFNMTAEQVTTQLAPGALMTLRTSSFADNELTLNFEDATTIEAGKPYIIKWDAAAQNLVNPTFSGITISSATANVETTNIDFIGCTSPAAFTANDRSKLFLGTNDKLYYPNADMTVNSCRGYFQLKGIEAGDKANVKEFRLNFGEGEDADGIGSMYDERCTMYDGEGVNYNLAGQRISKMKKGINIVNGKKVLY